MKKISEQELKEWLQGVGPQRASDAFTESVMELIEIEEVVEKGVEASTLEGHLRMMAPTSTPPNFADGIMTGIDRHELELPPIFTRAQIVVFSLILVGLIASVFFLTGLITESGNALPVPDQYAWMLDGLVSFSDNIKWFIAGTAILVYFEVVLTSKYRVKGLKATIRRN